jgi:hypothetical protein
VTRASGKTPVDTRTEVEAIHAAQRLAAAAPRASPEGQSLKPAPRVDAVFHDVSFRPTEAASTMGDLARALRDNDVELLT